MHPRLGSIIATGLALLLAPGAVTAAQGQLPGTDLYGDPLPGGALARLGTERLRPGRNTYALAFTGDGKLLASTHDDAHVDLWDAATGAHRGRLSAPAGARLRCLACSADGKYLVVGDDEENRLWIWDLGTANPPRQLRGHTSAPRTVAFSPDCKTVASASYYESNKHTDDAVRLWDSASGQQISQVKGHKYGTVSVAFAQGGKRLVGAGYDSVLRVWDLAGGKEVSQHDLPGRGMTARLLADGKTMAVLVWKDRDVVVELWDMAAGKAAQRGSYPGSESRGLAASPTSNRLALVGPEGMHLVNADTGAVVRTIRSAVGYHAPAFAPDGKRLAAASPERIRLWNADTGKELSPAGGPDGKILLARFLPGGKQIVTANSDQTVRLWDAATGKQVRKTAVDTDLQSSAFDLSPDGKTLALPHLAGNTVILWNVAKGKPAKTYRVGDFTEVLQFRFSPDGKVLAAASYARSQNHRLPGIHEVHLMDVATGKRLHVLEDESGPIVSLTFSPDSKRLVVTAFNDEYYWTEWDVSAGQKLHKGVLEGRPLFYLPDGQTLALATQAKRRDYSGVRFWDLKTGKTAPRMPEGPSAYFLGVAPDRAAVIFSDPPWNEGPLTLRDLSTGKLLARLGGAHRGWINEAVFSHDGARLATVGGDTTVVVWDVAALRKAQAARRTPLSAGDLKKLWHALGTEPAETTLEVFDRLAEDPEAVAAFLKDQLTAVSDAGLVGWVADLDAPAFAKRDQAMRELRDMEFAAAPALKQVLGGTPTLELRQRVERLLNELDEPAAHHLRRWRAVTVLEQLGTPAAWQLLEALAKGAPAARLTRDAQTALRRLATADKGP
jgi:WD40 repeat protein